MPEAPKAPESAPTTTLVVEYPSDVFDPSIKGIDPITASGTEVPADQAATIINTAMVYGVSVVAQDRPQTQG